MQLSYFKDTDTLYCEFASGDAETYEDLNEDTLLELDGSGRLLAITFEHASERTDLDALSLNGLSA